MTTASLRTHVPVFSKGGKLSLSCVPTIGRRYSRNQSKASTTAHVMQSIGKISYFLF